MRIIIDILHPAHVHFFMNFIKEMRKRGHEILVTARKKEMSLDLLNLYNINYIKLSEITPGIINRILELIKRDLKFYKIARKFKPDFTTGIMGATIATTNPFLKSKSVVFWDTEIGEFANKVIYALSSFVCNPTCYEGNFNKRKSKYIRYPGYHELAYLHPKRFKPDKGILKEVGLKKGEKYFIVRFVSWGAYHDIKEKGFVDKIKFIKELEKYGRILITSEQELPEELKKYQIKVPYHKIHDLIAYSAMCIGESATMASEAACLGVPAIFISSTKRGYTNEQDKKYGMVFNFSDQEKAMEKTFKLLKRKNLKREFQKKRKKMLKDKIDVTAWMIKFFEDKFKSIKK